MEDQIISQLDKLSPLTLLILGIAYTVGKAMSSDLKQSTKKVEEIDAKFEKLSRELDDIKDERSRYDKKKAD